MKKNKMILADGCAYSLNSIKTSIANNVLVIGSTGSGKTRGIVKPNILQAYGSYIIGDPKGNLYYEFKDYLLNKGYDVYLVDFKNPKNSAKYNMLDYVKSEEDIMKIAKMIINTRDVVSKSDPYWGEAGATFLASIIALVLTEFPKEKQNMAEVAKIINTNEVPIYSKKIYEEYLQHQSKPCSGLQRIKNINNNEEEISYRIKKEPINEANNKKFFSAFDKIKINNYFNYLKEYKPGLASQLYSQMVSNDMDATTTKECIRMSTVETVKVMVSANIKKMISSSDFNIADIGTKKTAVFVSASDTDRSQDSLVNIFYSQCLNVLCDFADQCCKNNSLPIEVRFILDDFATNCKIEDFDKSIAMIRSRRISAIIMIQNIDQLNRCYEQGGNTICANCDTWVYLGGNDMNTASIVAKQIDVPYYRIYELKNDECYIYRRGERPRKAKKINYNKYFLEFSKNMNNEERMA